mgnify:CR=1 FL=1
MGKLRTLVIALAVVITVNAVLPGWITTELTERAQAEVPGLYRRVLGRIPTGRWGDWDDMAGVAVVLAAIWGGSYGYQFVEGTWAEGPFAFTLIVAVVAGVIIGLAVDGVLVDDIATTAKTFPGFPDAWSRLF